MRVPLGWLRDYVDLDRPSAEIAERLAMLGFPVENIEPRGYLSGVVTGKLTKVEKHPNADLLQICTVDIGDGRPLTIATAAKNIALGNVVPVARVGAKLVGIEIAPRKMRGIDSEGMLVSAEEIGLPKDWFEDGILQLEPDVPLGSDVLEIGGLRGDVLDVEITTNRVDVMSIAGIARELAAAFTVPLREPVAFEPALSGGVREAQAGDLRLALRSNGVRRYVAQRFNGEVGVAPFWMRSRLALAGQRPRSNVVDVTNFVMLELGMPLHAFDFAKLAGGELAVRDAREGEALKTLDGQTRTLDARTLVIAGPQDACAIAGIMGGESTEVTGNTREIALESAIFDATRIRRASRTLALRTEASSRHERNLSLAFADAGAARAAALLRTLGWNAQPALATGEDYTPPPPIAASATAIGSLLGFPLQRAEVEVALRALGFAVRDESGATLATPPWWRTDVSIAADVAEEVGRVAGYDRIPATIPAVASQSISSETFDRESQLASQFAALGYHEVMTFALQGASVAQRFAAAGIAPQGALLEIKNPLSEDQRFGRFSLLPALLELVERYNAPSLRLFELGHTFARNNDGLPAETSMAACVLAVQAPSEPSWRDDGFLECKGDVEALLRAATGRFPTAQAAQSFGLHPGKTARLSLDGIEAAYVGAIDPRLLAVYGIQGSVYAGVLDLAALPGYALPAYEAPSRFPAVERDLAIVIDPQTPAGDIVRVVHSSGDGLLRRVSVFDEYRGPQVGETKKSVALRILLQRDDATLTDAQADAAIARILADLQRELGASLRT